MGLLQGLSREERKEKYGDSLRIKELDAYYFQPPGGESIANVCLRVERWLSDLKRSSSGMRVVCVCHGNVVKALRIRIEKIKQQDWIELGNPINTTQNCHVLHYSRRDPRTGRISNDFKFMRSVCPWDMRRSPNEWVEIIRPSFSNESLRESIELVPRIVNNRPGDNLAKLLAEDIKQVRYEKQLKKTEQEVAEQNPDEEVDSGEITITEYE